MRTAFVLLACLVGSVLVGVLAGYIAVAALPCSWFGSNFEGACGYGALWVSIGIGFVVAAVVFGLLTFCVLGNARQQKQVGQRSLRSLLSVWFIAMIASVAAPQLSPYAGLGDIFVVPVSLFTLAFFMAVSFALVRKLKMNSLLALLPLIPLFGTLALAFLILRAYRATPQSAA